VEIGAICFGLIAQPPSKSSPIAEVTLPKDVASGTVFKRYALAGEDFGGWVQRRSGVSSYAISTVREGRPTPRIRGIVYAPRCAAQTFDLQLSTSNYKQYPFFCQPLSDLWIAGTVIESDRLYGRQVKVHAKFLVRWAQQFLGINTELLTSIPLGDAVNLSPHQTFLLSVPDFAEDPVAGAPDHEGEIQIWATDNTTGDIVALLVPTEPAALRVGVGGLRLQREYPSKIIFTPCASGHAQVHDAIGFARRPDYQRRVRLGQRRMTGESRGEHGSVIKQYPQLSRRVIHRFPGAVTTPEYGFWQRQANDIRG
jgi:hypothetical protein